MSISDDEIAAIEQRAQAATQGWYICSKCGASTSGPEVMGKCCDAGGSCVWGPETTDVSRLCAALREARKEMVRTRIEDRRTIDAALCERDEAWAEVARLREALTKIVHASLEECVRSDIARAVLSDSGTFPSPATTYF